MAIFFYKVTFTACCDQSTVDFQIQTANVNSYLTQDGVYIYNGSDPKLIVGKCYTYTVDTSGNVNGYNLTPDISEFTVTQGCQDPLCETCEQCYIITNCSIEGTPPIIVTNDLSQYVGKSIYLCPENFPTNPTPPADPGVPYIIPNDQPVYFGTLINCCDPTDRRYISNDFASFPSTGVIVIPNIDSIGGASTTCWKYEKGQDPQQTYVFVNLTGALFYENCAVCNQQNPCVVYPIITECYCYSVEESQTCESAITITLPTTVEEYNDCLACRSQREPKCYLLIDCSNPNNVIIVKNDFEVFVGKVIKTRYCDTCWKVLPAPSCVGSIPVEDAVASFDLCVDCLPPTPEPESNLKPRRIPPGYSTPGCSPEYTEKVDCNFADQAFDKMSSIRYGINSCCEEDFDRWDIKKRLLDLKAINTPTSELLPLQCKCYRLQVLQGDVEFKYISCEGQVTYVTLGDTQIEDLLIVCAQTYPRAVCPATGTSYSIIMQNDCVNGQC